MKPVPPVIPDLATNELDDNTTGLDLMGDFAKRMGLTEEINSGKMQGGVPVEINGVPVPKDLYTPEQLKKVNAAQKINDMMTGGETVIPITKDNSFDAQFQAQLQAKKDAMSGDATLAPKFTTPTAQTTNPVNPTVVQPTLGSALKQLAELPSDAELDAQADKIERDFAIKMGLSPLVSNKPTGQTPPPVVIMSPAESKSSTAPTVINNNSTTHLNMTKDPADSLMFNQMLGGF
jgi:hypothetical protein